jgi:succinate dehydrogenase / fumarate reductase cytochrome b subunit
MSWLLRFYSSTIGMKVVMAVTGIVLYGFVTFHMLGNTQIFLGKDEINHYAQLLHTSEEVVWGARLTLIGSTFLHILSATRLMVLSGKARTVAYAKRTYGAATFASLTMRFSGVLLLSFIIYHLGHFTTGTFFGSGFQLQPGLAVNDVWHNVTTAFKNPLIVAFYVVSQLSLGAHLYHGAVSLFRTLGLTGERQQQLLGTAARLLVAAIVVGNISIPVAVLLGIVGGAQ